MKKLLIACICMVCLTSCFNTRMYVGNMQPDDPASEVNKQWNSHFVVGLVPGKDAKMKPETYLPSGQQDYMVHTYTSFVNGLLNVVTFGIYTPTTTKYYVPAGSGN